MEIIYPHDGQAVLLDILFDDQAVLNSYLALYDNDFTPDVDSDYSDFSVCDYTGYANKTLSRGSWNIAQGSGSTKSSVDYAEQEFSCSSTPSPAAYAYGYLIFMIVGIVPHIVAACRFDVPVLIVSTATISVTPKLQIGDWAA